MGKVSAAVVGVLSWLACQALFQWVGTVKPVSVVFPHEALVQAAREGNHSALILALAEGASVLASDSLALHGACEAQNVDVVRTLLEFGADPDVRDGACLVWAARVGNEALVRVLLQFGANSGRRESLALRLAARTGSFPTVETLLDHPNTDLRAARDDAQSQAMKVGNVQMWHFLWGKSQFDRPRWDLCETGDFIRRMGDANASFLHKHADWFGRGPWTVEGNWSLPWHMAFRTLDQPNACGVNRGLMTLTERVSLEDLRVLDEWFSKPLSFGTTHSTFASIDKQVASLFPAQESIRWTNGQGNWTQEGVRQLVHLIGPVLSGYQWWGRDDRNGFMSATWWGFSPDDVEKATLPILGKGSLAFTRG